jgi:glutamate-ammonia-ligase adenylyltransferase
MSTALQITRLPRPFDPDLGGETLAKLPELTGDLAALVTGTAGSSPYLKGLLEREAAWIVPALQDPDAAVQGVFDDTRALAPDQLSEGLRRGKRRLALLTALADLSGAWPRERVTGALTDYGGLACDVALKAELTKLVSRKKLPGMTLDDIETACGMTVLAMGKMGAHELNYSSDIDLICLFDETRYEPADFFEARQAMVRATRNMAALLNDRTAEGYVFRTDLRLRPDPAVTPVCLSMAAAETYYESLGRTWERAAYIKARPCAGDLEAGAKFLQTLRPFVWRRHLDFAAIQDAHDIRLRIRENKGGHGPVSVPGHDRKLGRGGIREIEFFTQTRQLIAGGRDPGLRLRGTVEGLAALADRNWVAPDVAQTLTDHYRQHREIEHRIQMVNDAQTHKVPASDEGLERVACLMGVDRAQLIADLEPRLAEVHALTEDFFAPGGEPAPKPAAHEGTFDTSIIAGWGSYPALRTERAQRIFDRLKPELLSRLAGTAKPDEALRALDGFLAGLPAGVQLFSLFEANPQLMDLLVDIVGTSHELASFLSRNSGVFDAVLGGQFFADWPGMEVLKRDLTAILDHESDYETKLDAARRWMKEWHFRIGVHHLRGLIDGVQAGREYAELAEIVIACIAPVVVAQFSIKHGPPPGRGAAVLAMGSLGAGRINAQSDLDVIAIYDPLDATMSEGAKPLSTRPYYARLTQAMITALSAPMSQGRLYEVDMRLRPSGQQGPVATSLASFQNYQRNEAWTWEHLALTRARVVAGDPTLAQDIESFRETVIRAEPDRPAILRDVRDMRDRLAAAKPPASVWDAKTGAGRMMDIELMSQTGALLSGSTAHDVPGGLQGGVTAGWLSQAQAQTLTEGYDLFWSVQTASRLISSKVLDTDHAGESGAAFLCRTTGFDTLDALQMALDDAYGRCQSIIETALDVPSDKKEHSNG